MSDGRETMIEGADSLPVWKPASKGLPGPPGSEIVGCVTCDAACERVESGSLCEGLRFRGVLRDDRYSTLLIYRYRQRSLFLTRAIFVTFV